MSALVLLVLLLAGCCKVGARVMGHRRTPVLCPASQCLWLPRSCTQAAKEGGCDEATVDFFLPLGTTVNSEWTSTGCCLSPDHRLTVW